MTTLGQPLEVVKTQMASQRGDTMGTALRKVWGRGGVLGCAALLPFSPSCTPQAQPLTRRRLANPAHMLAPAVYQGLIPWAWIEASTKGAVLLFAAAEIEAGAMTAGIGPATAGLLGGMGGGVAQAYATVGALPWSSSSCCWSSRGRDKGTDERGPWGQASARA